ncbi:MAG: DNA methyltransferase, partial [Lentilitoribacter sp.]
MAIKLNIKTISDALPPALKAFSPAKAEFEKFKSNLETYFSRIDSSESEENLKTHLMDLFKSYLSPSHVVEQQGTIDFVIRAGGKKSPAAVLVEAKRAANKSDMIRKDDLNRKALHELVLYFMRERRNKNTDIRHLVICTEHEFYIFVASSFERTFHKNSKFRNDFEAWEAGKKSDNTTDFFYKEIAAPFIVASDAEITATHIDLREYQDQAKDDSKDRELVKLFKLLSPHFLLKKDLANDSNSLNKSFYDELLHIIGLEERKDGSKRVIGRLEDGKRNVGSLLENTIEQVRLEQKFQSQEMRQLYGNSNHEREFNIALELCLTWVNRLLFLKLLEAQIFKFHAQDESYKFLSINLVTDFNDLSDLFFKVLAFDPSERSANIQSRYGKIPYLNSSLFELTELEQFFRITLLNNGYELPIFKKTVLRNGSGSKVEGTKNSLAYVFNFLDAYDFGAVSGENVREDSKTIINAAVLGLIFEKINGYKEGAIFTPGYVTMFMARKVIEKTVIEAFEKKYPDWKLADLDDLRNNITDRSKASILDLNAIIDELKVCDPAVGSGHFLVSVLNELIALKSRLGILADAEGKLLSEYTVEVDNDELIIVNSNTDEVFAYQVQGNNIPKTIQHVQQTLFHEKQKLIENCLFGVDINANSVRICQLRLWIELLKSAYYRDRKDDQLETLPNIDINIKCGNSLLSRFRLDQNLSDAFNKAGLTVGQYRKLVSDYKNSKDKSVKHDLLQQIAKAKTRFQEESLGRITKEIDAAIAQLKADEAQADLFVLGEEQQSKQNAKIADIRSKVSMMEVRREKLLQNKTFLNSMEWRFEFPEILDDNAKVVGFDIIIANPPYMRIQEIEATQPLQKELYERDYRTAHGSYDLA